jgi:hypothetical protein
MIRAYTVSGLNQPTVSDTADDGQVDYLSSHPLRSQQAYCCIVLSPPWLLTVDSEWYQKHKEGYNRVIIMLARD